MVEMLWLIGIILYTHKQLTDNCDLTEVARQFCAVSDECRSILVHLNGSVFSSHLIYQILMIINFPTNTLSSAYVPPPPPSHLKVSIYIACMWEINLVNPLPAYIRYTEHPQYFDA